MQIEKDINVDAWIDLEIEDIIDALEGASTDEIKTLVDWLKDSEYIRDSDLVYENSNSVHANMFVDSLQKIEQNYYLLTPEELAFIEQLANKY
jgi:hypothetical protein